MASSGSSVLTDNTDPQLERTPSWMLEDIKAMTEERETRALHGTASASGGGGRRSNAGGAGGDRFGGAGPGHRRVRSARGSQAGEEIFARNTAKYANFQQFTARSSVAACFDPHALRKGRTKTVPELHIPIPPEGDRAGAPSRGTSPQFGRSRQERRQAALNASGKRVPREVLDGYIAGKRMASPRWSAEPCAADTQKVLSPRPLPAGVTMEDLEHRLLPDADELLAPRRIRLGPGRVIEEVSSSLYYDEDEDDEGEDEDMALPHAIHRQPPAAPSGASGQDIAQGSTGDNIVANGGGGTAVGDADRTCETLPPLGGHGSQASHGSQGSRGAPQDPPAGLSQPSHGGSSVASSSPRSEVGHLPRPGEGEQQSPRRDFVMENAVLASRYPTILQKRRQIMADVSCAKAQQAKILKQRAVDAQKERIAATIAGRVQRAQEEADAREHTAVLQSWMMFLAMARFARHVGEGLDAARKGRALVRMNENSASRIQANWHRHFRRRMSVALEIFSEKSGSLVLCMNIKRKRRATSVVKEFLLQCEVLRSTRVVRKFLFRVRKCQQFARAFVQCRRARLQVLNLYWIKLETQHRRSMQDRERAMKRKLKLEQNVANDGDAAAAGAGAGAKRGFHARWMQTQSKTKQLLTYVDTLELALAQIDMRDAKRKAGASDGGEDGDNGGAGGEDQDDGGRGKGKDEGARTIRLLDEQTRATIVEENLVHKRKLFMVKIDEDRRRTVVGKVSMTSVRSYVSERDSSDAILLHEQLIGVSSKRKVEPFTVFISPFGKDWRSLVEEAVQAELEQHMKMTRKASRTASLRSLHSGSFGASSGHLRPSATAVEAAARAASASPERDGDPEGEQHREQGAERGAVDDTQQAQGEAVEAGGNGNNDRSNHETRSAEASVTSSNARRNLSLASSSERGSVTTASSEKQEAA